jgi:hypothetical protein
MGSRNVNMCSKDRVDPGSFWGLMGSIWSSGGVFLMGYKNFEVPERVDSDNSTKIAKVRKL